MKQVRSAVVVGCAVAALAAAGSGTAFAWHPSDAALTVGCRTDETHVQVVLGNNYKAKGDYTFARQGSDEKYTGTVDAHGTVKLTVGYTGKGDTWRYTLADTHVDKKIADVPLCTPPSTPPSPSVPPSGRPTPPPSGTPSPSASVPAASPSTPTSGTPTPSGSATPDKPKLAETGGGSNGGLIAAVGGGAVLVGVGVLVAARRKGRHGN
ncbi:LPXTG cell wall anchor domain-containing protein [Kitasatospora sp. NPDC094015]|uniref:LPXTG cell wall anchor domain-containing protein n=1 Tax=Kitasatospora sp. NPDC094015 TaxID=3155205 RepID=UPI003333F4D8